MPPLIRIPKLVQGVGFVLAREMVVGRLSRRYGSAFTLDLPIFGPTVVISDRAAVKELFTTSSELIGRAGQLGDVLGPGSTFSLDGAEHRQRRKLLAPPFHGKRMQGYEHIIEEEMLRETATWPQGREFAAMPSMMRITLNAILRAVFGAQGAALEDLRELLPILVLRASRPGGVAAGGTSGLRSDEPGRQGAEAARPLRPGHRRADLRRPSVTRTCRSALMCWRCCWRPATRTAPRFVMTTSPMSC